MAPKPIRRKTLRRSQRMAQTFARQLRESGHTEISIEKITPTDWAIRWTLKPR